MPARVQKGNDFINTIISIISVFPVFPVFIYVAVSPVWARIVVG